MALPIQDEESSNQLTAAEKFRRFKIRALVEIKLIARYGGPAVWARARVLNTNKGGAWCKTEKGKEQFFHWSEVRAPPPDTPDPHRPLATLGEIVEAAGGPALRALPPYLDTEPPKPPVPPPPPPPPAARKEAVLISRADMTKKPRQKHLHKITPIANLFREQRLMRGWAQSQLADHLSINGLVLSDQQISRIELGRLDPTDDILIAFAEVCGLDLDKVVSAARGATEAAPDKPHVPHVPPVTVPAPAPAEPARPLPPDAAERFAQFTDELYSLAPPPLDREKRKEWFRCAAKLYQLSES